MSYISKQSTQFPFKILITILLSNLAIADKHNSAAQIQALGEKTTKEIQEHQANVQRQIDTLNERYPSLVDMLKKLQRDSKNEADLKIIEESTKENYFENEKEAQKLLTEKMREVLHWKLINEGLSPSSDTLKRFKKEPAPSQENFEKAWKALKEELAFLNDKYGDKIKPLKETLFKMFGPKPDSTSEPRKETRTPVSSSDSTTSNSPPKHGAELPNVSPLESRIESVRPKVQSPINKKEPINGNDGQPFQSLIELRPLN